jgi:ATP-dependent Clp endopeptidase proteolytic subunit ClpP
LFWHGSQHGVFLLGAGAPGKQKALPNARIMIHNPLGGAQGQVADSEIQAKEILFISEVLNMYIAEYCDQPKEKIEADCDGDFFMTAEEAVNYGIIALAWSKGVTGREKTCHHIIFSFMYSHACLCYPY